MIYLRYLKALIVNNPAKIIFILLTVIPFFLLLKEKDVYIDKKNYVVNKFEFEKDNSYYYLVDNIKNGHIPRFTVEELDSKQDISKGYYITKERRVIYYFEIGTMILFSVILLITHLFIIFDGTAEFKWYTDDQIGDIRIGIYKKLIKCELDDGIYCYTVDKRLIYQSSTNAHEDRKLDYALDSFIKNKNLFPLFETKREKRKASLNNFLK